MSMPLSLADPAVADMLVGRNAGVVGRGRALGRIATGAARRPSTPGAVLLAAGAAGVVVRDEVSYCARRELRLGDEPHCRTRRDEVDEVQLGERRDEDQLRPALTRE